jgi:hypothetical protein
MTFPFLDEEDPDFAINVKIRPLSIKEGKSRHEEMRSRLDGWCKGLFEITSNPDTSLGPWFKFNIDFLHRTVRDFLLLPDMQSMLKQRLKPGFTAKLLLCKAFLAQLKTTPIVEDLKQSPEAGPFDDLLEDIFCYAREVEMESLDMPEENRVRLLSLLFTILEEAGRVLYDSSSHWRFKSKKNMFLGLAVDRGLQCYTKKKLGASIKLLHAHARPLLDFALRPSDSKYNTAELSPEMIDILLFFGADPNRRYKDSTLWGYFLFQIYSREMPPPTKTELAVLGMLIKHGADLEKEFKFEERLKLERQTGRATDVHRLHAITSKYWTASEMISERFSTEDASFLFSKAPSIPGLFARLAGKY